MKGKIIAIIFIVFAFLACNNSQKQQNATTTSDINEELTKEIETIDSTTQVIDKINSDIQSATQELDEILKEL